MDNGSGSEYGLVVRWGAAGQKGFLLQHKRLFLSPNLQPAASSPVEITSSTSTGTTAVVSPKQRRSSQASEGSRTPSRRNAGVDRVAAKQLTPRKSLRQDLKERTSSNAVENGVDASPARSTRQRTRQVLEREAKKKKPGNVQDETGQPVQERRKRQASPSSNDSGDSDKNDSKSSVDFLAEVPLHDDIEDAYYVPPLGGSTCTSNCISPSHATGVVTVPVNVFAIADGHGGRDAAEWFVRASVSGIMDLFREDQEICHDLGDKKWVCGYLAKRVKDLVMRLDDEFCEIRKKQYLDHVRNLQEPAVDPRPEPEAMKHDTVPDQSRKRKRTPIPSTTLHRSSPTQASAVAQPIPPPFPSPPNDGTTLNLSIILGNEWLVNLNIGDSRGIVGCTVGKTRNVKDSNGRSTSRSRTSNRMLGVPRSTDITEESSVSSAPNAVAHVRKKARIGEGILSKDGPVLSAAISPRQVMRASPQSSVESSPSSRTHKAPSPMTTTGVTTVGSRRQGRTPPFDILCASQDHSPGHPVKALWILEHGGVFREKGNPSSNSSSHNNNGRVPPTETDDQNNKKSSRRRKQRNDNDDEDDGEEDDEEEDVKQWVQQKRVLLPLIKPCLPVPPGGKSNRPGEGSATAGRKARTTKMKYVKQLSRTRIHRALRIVEDDETDGGGEEGGRTDVGCTVDMLDVDDESDEDGSWAGSSTSSSSSSSTSLSESSEDEHSSEDNEDSNGNRNRDLDHKTKKKDAIKAGGIHPILSTHNNPYGLKPKSMSLSDSLGDFYFKAEPRVFEGRPDMFALCLRSGRVFSDGEIHTMAEEWAAQMERGDTEKGAESAGNAGRGRGAVKEGERDPVLWTRLMEREGCALHIVMATDGVWGALRSTETSGSGGEANGVGMGVGNGCTGGSGGELRMGEQNRVVMNAVVGMRDAQRAVADVELDALEYSSRYLGRDRGKEGKDREENVIGLGRVVVGNADVEMRPYAGAEDDDRRDCEDLAKIAEALCDRRGDPLGIFKNIRLRTAIGFGGKVDLNGREECGSSSVTSPASVQSDASGSSGGCAGSDSNLTTPVPTPSKRVVRARLGGFQPNAGTTTADRSSVETLEASPSRDIVDSCVIASELVDDISAIVIEIRAQHRCKTVESDFAAASMYVGECDEGVKDAGMVGSERLEKGDSGRLPDVAEDEDGNEDGDYEDYEEEGSERCVGVDLLEDLANDGAVFGSSTAASPLSSISWRPSAPQPSHPSEPNPVTRTIPHPSKPTPHSTTHRSPPFPHESRRKRGRNREREKHSKKHERVVDNSCSDEDRRPGWENDTSSDEDEDEEKGGGHVGGDVGESRELHEAMVEGLAASRDRRGIKEGHKRKDLENTKEINEVEIGFKIETCNPDQHGNHEAVSAENADHQSTGRDIRRNHTTENRKTRRVGFLLAPLTPSASASGMRSHLGDRTGRLMGKVREAEEPADGDDNNESLDVSDRGGWDVRMRDEEGEEDDDEGNESLPGTPQWETRRLF
ncbi:hypothetical protein HK102_013696 [Quaeritorhiza haematococci]|nr:hypothetical protein HK102_013696 [Quaeritorhiza haematococci]